MDLVEMLVRTERAEVLFSSLKMRESWRIFVYILSVSSVKN